MKKKKAMKPYRFGANAKNTKKCGSLKPVLEIFKKRLPRTIETDLHDEKLL